ncbi:MAG TPA: hypothetical protein VFL95_08480 [Gemmatimonadales bacterium]|nr:hypothetical protein [Gemmatimonadales bacterium]
MRSGLLLLATLVVARGAMAQVAPTDSSVDRPGSGCPVDVDSLDVRGWIVVAAPDARFCIPPGWRAIGSGPTPEAHDHARFGAPDGFVEWLQGPLADSVSSRDLIDATSGSGRQWAKPGGRVGDISSSEDEDQDEFAIRWVWSQTERAPEFVLRGRGHGVAMRDTLEAIARTVRFSGPAAAPPIPYFPLGESWGTPDSMNSFFNDQFSRQLRAMRDVRMPALAADSSVESYRITYLPTFAPGITERATQHGDSLTLVSIRLSGMGGFDPGHIKQRQVRILTRAEWASLKQALDSAQFWSMPTCDDGIGLDGTYVVVEGVRNGRYHVVVRWSPAGPKYAAFRAIGTAFSELTKPGRK